MQTHEIEAALEEAVLQCRNWNTSFVILTRSQRPKVLRVKDWYPQTPHRPAQEHEKFPGGGKEEFRPYLPEATDAEDTPRVTGIYELFEEVGLWPRAGCKPRVLGFILKPDRHLKVAIWLWDDEVSGELNRFPVENHSHGGKTYDQEWVDFYGFRERLTPGQHWIWDLVKSKILDIQFPQAH